MSLSGGLTHWGLHVYSWKQFIYLLIFFIFIFWFFICRSALVDLCAVIIRRKLTKQKSKSDSLREIFYLL